MLFLLLAGTGAMGTSLINVLSRDESNTIIVTTRSKRANYGNVIYMQGNAKEISFLDTLLDKEYDAIFDFLVYSTTELENRIHKLLDHTKQYFFFSSSRCYANSMSPITEESPRLVDVCSDIEYIATDEYALAKGREENILFSANQKNWTIIRPYITYNKYRLQLGVYEKENWLKRALDGRTIVFPKDISEKKTTLTYGQDVAEVLFRLVGNEKAFGEAFHIVTNEVYKWGEILELYLDVIENKIGTRPKVKIIDDSLGLQEVWNPWQIKYDRLYNREFDAGKLESVIGEYKFKPTFSGLTECLSDFLDDAKWLKSNIRYEAWCDRLTKEFMPLNQIEGRKAKLRYIKWRFIG